MNSRPWLSPEKLHLIKLIQASYLSAFGCQLITTQQKQKQDLLDGEALFVNPKVILSHDVSKEPILNYVNATALRLWSKTWNQMIGMPSKLTAPIEEQYKRHISLSKAIQVDAIEGYEGVRADSQGNKFLINDAKIWTVRDEDGNRIGQSACFESWTFL